MRDFRQQRDLGRNHGIAMGRGGDRADGGYALRHHRDRPGLGLPLGLSEPLVAALLGILYLRESPGPAALAGITLITTGLAVSGITATGSSHQAADGLPDER